MTVFRLTCLQMMLVIKSPLKYLKLIRKPIYELQAIQCQIVYVERILPEEMHKVLQFCDIV